MEILKKKKVIIALSIVITIAAVYILIGTSGKKGGGDDSESRENRYINLFHFLSIGEDLEQKEIDKSKIKTEEMEEAKLIKNIILEKNPVCSGEDVMVTVIASNPFGSSANLLYRVGNQRGNQVILRFKKPGPRSFYVVVRDYENHIDFREVPITVQDCPDRPFVFLRASLSRLNPEEADFEIAEQRGLTGKCVYEWDFGDGSRSTTSTGSISHSYAKREQAQFQTTFMVKVSVTDALKKKVAGRASISFPNIHYISKMMGNPILPVIYNRFPVLKNGIYEVPLTMKNIFDESVSFDEAVIEYKSCDSSWTPEQRSVSASSLLSTTYIQGKGSAESMLTFEQSQLPQSTCNLTIKLLGRMQGNSPVSAQVYLDIPPAGKDAIDTKRDKVVEDDEMIRKLNKAAQILGKGRPITPADIKRLEDEGKL